MGEPDGRRWTLLLLRDDGVRAGRWSFGSLSGGAAVAAGALLLLLAAGAAGGLWWAHRVEDERIRSLRSEVQALRAEREQVRRLAGRLDSIEEDYGRLRQAMGGEVAASERDVRLPPVGGRTEDGRTRPAERGDRWRWPLAREGFVTRSFDASGATDHPGMDVAVPSGSYVRATRSGVVAEAGTDTVYGRFVRLRHPDGSSSLYGHAEWLFVGSGDTVEGGEVIALSGNTGHSSAPHLHFEVRREGRLVDPARLLRGGTAEPTSLERQQGGGSP